VVVRRFIHRSIIYLTVSTGRGILDSSKKPGGLMSEKNAYEKVQALMSKDPQLGVGEACKMAKVKYTQYDYFKTKANGGKRNSRKPVATKTVRVKNRTVVVPRMETYEIPERQAQPRSTGRVVAVVGSPEDVAQALKEFSLRN
jgi:hypothetical protein